MAELKLHNGHNNDVTIISNQFIDRFMCEANGEFVKIYLYLLRCVNDTPKDFSISLIADKINLTENDVLRALRYWEKACLLTLDTDSENHVRSISLEETSAPKADVLKKPLTSHERAIEPAFLPIENYAPQNPDMLKTDTTLQQVLFITEQYIGRPLNSTEIMRIYYFYDILKFPADLIEYLVEHCVCNGKKSMRYIEKVALAWAEKGIHTVIDAKEESGTFRKDFFTILKAFGIRNRNPITAEITYMNKWLNTYSFTTDIITEACSRTVTQVGNASFPYADSILTSWHEKGIIMKKDIEALDADFHRTQTEQTSKPVANAPKGTRSSTNRFNNFEQRSYDYDELEKQLIQM